MSLCLVPFIVALRNEKGSYNTGCNAAADDWELRLYEFLTNAVRPKITRVDVAKDFFNGEYSPDQAAIDRVDGKYTNHHMMPDGEKAGSDWESNNGKGKTYYVGSRESSKFVRVYEKGKQLGDKQSSWVRFEIVSTHSRPKAAGASAETLAQQGLHRPVSLRFHQKHMALL